MTVGERFTTDAVLGVGGNGTVMAGRDLRSGELVAVKLPRSESESDHGPIRREIRFLRLLQHPHLVRYIDGDDGATPPWYAMERCDRTVRQILDGTGSSTRIATAASSDHHSDLPTERASEDSTRPTRRRSTAHDDWRPGPDLRLREDLDVEAFESVLRIVADACRGLAYLHERGLVHGDIKPENIFVAKGRGVIADLGAIAHVQGRSHRDVLADRSQLGMTRRYAAPELARREDYDARSDLFAVGCVLFALLFETPHEDVVSQMWVTSVDPAQVAESLGLDRQRSETLALATRLVPLRPIDRLGYAGEVANLLDDIVGRPTPTIRSRGSAAYVFRSPLRGRTALVRRLADAFHVPSGGGVAFGLLGPQGVGKTRVLQAVADTSRERGIALVLSPDQWGRSEVQGTLDLLASESERLHRRVFGDDEASEDAESEMSQVRRSPPVDRFKARSRPIVQRILRLVEDADCLVLLDDVELWDEDTLRVLGTVLQAASTTRPWFAFASRQLTVGNVERLLGVHLPRERIERLAPLDVDGCAEMVGAMLGSDHAPPEIVDTIFRISRGNPQLVGEALRTSIERGHVWRDLGQWSHAFSQPALPFDTDDEQTVYRERLHGLDAGSLELLGLASIWGLAGPNGVLVGESHSSDAARRHLALKGLVGAGFLDDVDGGWQFSSRGLRELMLRELTQADQLRLHGIAVERIESGQFPSEDIIERLVFHLERAGKPAEAWDRAVVGVRQLWTEARFEACRTLLDAIERLEQAGHGGHLPSELFVWDADVRAATGDTAASVQACHRGLERLGTAAPDSAGAALGYAAVEVARAARKTLVGRVVSAPPSSDSEARASLVFRNHLLTAYFDSDDMGGVMAQAAAGAATALRHPHLPEGSRSVATLGAALVATGARGVGVRLLDRAKSGARGEDPVARTQACIIEASAVMNLGAWPRFHAALGTAIELVDAHDLVTAHSDVLRTCSIGAWLEGDVQRAVETATEALDVARVLGLAWQARWARLALAAARLREGLPMVSLEHVDELRRDLARTGHALLLANALAVEIGAQARLGRIERSLEVLRELDTLARDRRSLMFSSYYAHLFISEALVAALASSRGEEAWIKARLTRALRAANSHARMAPVAVPLVHAHRGRAARLGGNERAARRSLERSRSEARTLGMRFDETVAEALIAGTRDDDRTRRLRFARLGCVAPPC